MLPEPPIGSWSFYTIFSIIVIIMLALDMFALKKSGTHTVRFREALIWSVVWIIISCLFGLYVYWAVYSNPSYGHVLAREKTIEFFTAYVLEKSLAVDNLFVFLMIFSQFKIPAKYQHRVLLYGVLGAIFLRVLMIILGALLVQKFSWILYIFGGFLVITGIKMFLPEQEDNDLSQNWLLKIVKKWLPISPTLSGEQFFIRDNGKLIATPLFLVLILVEMSDIIFATDSIPAIFAVSTDPFILLTSNIFAILGLRAMYFLLAGVVKHFIFLPYALAVILTFIGIKMLITHWIHIPTSISLIIIFSVLAMSIILSILHTRSLKKM